MPGDAELKQTIRELLPIPDVVYNEMAPRGAGKFVGYDANVRDAVPEIPGYDIAGLIIDCLR